MGPTAFPIPPPPEAGSGKLLIVVEARSRKFKSPLESPATPAQLDLSIDLAPQPRDGSEYAELQRAVRPLLQRLDLSDLVENDVHHDITFLAEETGNAKEQIVRLTLSARLEEAYKIPSAVFFAFLRQHIPSSLPSPLLDATRELHVDRRIGPKDRIIDFRTLHAGANGSAGCGGQK